MKRIYYIILSILALFLVYIIVYVYIYPLFHSQNRTYNVNVYNIGYNIKIEEVQHDTVLCIKFNKTNSNNYEYTELYVHNRCCDGIEFVFYEGIDTIFIRKEPRFYEEFSPNEQYKWKDEIYDKGRGGVKDITVGNLPSKIKLISYSEPRFFKYENDSSDHCIPINDKISSIYIWHNCDRGNIYELCYNAKKRSQTIILNENTTQNIR